MTCRAAEVTGLGDYETVKAHEEKALTLLKRIGPAVGYWQVTEDQSEGA
jgi:hypothetical protein